jgi:hypothetical protein
MLPPSNFSPDDQAASSEKILHAAARHVDVPLDAVEDEELGFRAEVGGVADAGGLQVGLGALGDRTRVAVVALAVGRLDHVAGDDQRGLVEERVDEGGSGSGISSMSEAWMPFQPAIDEPSNAWPSSNLSASKA